MTPLVYATVSLVTEEECLGYTFLTLISALTMSRTARQHEMMLCQVLQRVFGVVPHIVLTIICASLTNASFVFYRVTVTRSKSALRQKGALFP